MSFDEQRDPNINPGAVVHVDFRPRRSEYVFECNCGCQLFYLHADGCVVCRACAAVKHITWERTP